MKETEFNELLRAWWKLKYPVKEKPAKDALHAADDIIEDVQERVDLLLYLKRYAREVQVVGSSRSKKNKAQRIFDELGIDPRDIEF